MNGQASIFDYIEPEERAARWKPIKRGDKGYSVADFICSACGKGCPCYHLTRYCPNCGARMEGR